MCLAIAYGVAALLVFELAVESYQGKHGTLAVVVGALLWPWTLGYAARQTVRNLRARRRS